MPNPRAVNVWEHISARDLTHTDLSSYVHITLTDEDNIPDAIGKLRAVYHNLMKLDYDNLRTRNINTVDGAENIEKKSPYEHFSEFYEKQNNQPMSDNQVEFVKKMIEEIWEGEI